MTVATTPPVEFVPPPPIPELPITAPPEVIVGPEPQVPPAPPQGGGGGARRSGLPSVRDTTNFNPEMKAQVAESIRKLLGGEGFDNLDTQQAILRGETANAVRDQRLLRREGSAASGVGGSGGARRADSRFRQEALSARLKGLTDLNTRSQQFGLARTQTGLGAAGQQEQLHLAAEQMGISRDLGIRGQDLQDLISKRQASVQRYGIDANREIAANELALRREGLEQDIIEQNRRFGLDTTAQELDEAYRQAGLAQQNDHFSQNIQQRQLEFDSNFELENRRFDLNSELGRQEQDRLDQALASDTQFRELDQTLRMLGLPGIAEMFPDLFGGGGGGNQTLTPTSTFP